MIRHRLWTLALAALLAAPASAPAAPGNKPRFQVNGTAVILHKNRARAMDRAVDAGLRRAVYQALLQSLGEASMIQFRGRIEGALLKEARQYVQSYRVLGYELATGSRTVKDKLEVVVDLSAVDEAVRALQLAKVEKGEARLLFLIEEQIIRSGLGGRKTTTRLGPDKIGTAERRMMYAFARIGYTPVNPRGQREPARPGQIHAAISGDVDAAQALGSLYGCPFVITAMATVERERGGAVVSLASARVIRTEDGAVIAIRSRQVRYRRARGRRGYRNALASASSRLARSLIPEIRRVFPPPPRPASRGSRRRRRRAPRRRQ